MWSSRPLVPGNYKQECEFLDMLYTTNLHQLITYKTSMSVSPFSISQVSSPAEFCRPTTSPVTTFNGSPKILTNFILKPPSESQRNLDVLNLCCRKPNEDQKRLELVSTGSIFQKYKEKDSCWERRNLSQIKQEEDVRVKVKLNKKGKRDGQNIRTYARYDSVIQALQQELVLHKIVPTTEDKKMLDEFEMKSKRSLERFFFYLLLVKRENKLQILLPNLKLKIRAKIQQKGGHRTNQFLTSLQNCIQKYIDAAQKLDKADTPEQAKNAFSIAYLSDLSDNGNYKRPPHHNKIKGIAKCMKLYKMIIGKSQHSPTQSRLGIDALLQENEKKSEFIEHSSKSIEDLPQKMICQSQHHKVIQNLKPTKKKPEQKREDQSFSVVEDEQKDMPGDKKKKVGIKNKKQDDRDIQKYAKFDIVSESSLQFLKMQKLQKSIPEICRKLSQRSLHFFFVILAMIQKQKKDGEFLAHLETNYERKVQKRYSQRSQYFRQRLHQSFFNLIQATRALFQGNLQKALDIAYQVKSEKKTHPAKASQQKRCKEIYEAIRSSFEGNGEQSKLKLQLLIQSDKGHRSQLIKQIKSPCPKSIAQVHIQRNLQRLKLTQTGPENPLDLPQPQPHPQPHPHPQPQLSLTPNNQQCKIQQQQAEKYPSLLEIKQKAIEREPTGILIPIPQRLTYFQGEHLFGNY